MAPDTSKSNAQVTPRPPEPFQFRGRQYTMVVFYPTIPNHPDFIDILEKKIAQAPNFFTNAPLVVDLDALLTIDEQVSVKGLFDMLRTRGLMPVGVQGGDEEMQRQALSAGIPVFPDTGRQAHINLSPPPKEEQEEEQPDLAEEQEAEDTHSLEDEHHLPVHRATTMVVSTQVRSGQQVYAPQGDLVCTAPVSAGAEALADGNVHIYGPLRGRAFAGVSGDRSARIFCSSLQAELVSIAGVYLVSEQIEKNVLKKSVQIYLQNGTVQIDVLSSP